MLVVVSQHLLVETCHRVLCKGPVDEERCSGKEYCGQIPVNAGLKVCAKQYLPQFLDIWGNPRQAVDAIHHAVFFDEFGTALEDLGHCEQKKNSVSSPNTSLSQYLSPVFSECHWVKYRVADLFEVRVECSQAWVQGLFGQEAANSKRILGVNK